MGCDLIQGFIFSAALGAEEFARYLTPEGRRVPIQPIEACALSGADFVDAEMPTLGGGVAIASGEAVASEEKQGDPLERYALVIDDDRMQIGRTAMRMNQIGIPSYYARDLDEGILFALQEPGRIRALLVSSEANPSDVERVAQQVANQSQGDRPSIVVVGEEFDPAAITDLQRKGPVWSLRIPFDDAELNFVVDTALSKERDVNFLDRNRVPIHLVVWLRTGGVAGHGVISLLSPRGAFIEMDDPLPVGTAFQLEFSLSEWPVSIRARVVYLVSKDAGDLGRPRGVGVVFLDCDRETGDRIFEEVEKRAARYTP
jgi:Tfp pilus assembly protein PilZ